ncbi:TNF receptor-associated factor 5-like isoform X2 [Montipora capricornis]
MIKPVCLGCGHSGCKACIQELISNARSRRCPACREAVDASQIRDNVALGQMISEFPVHCLSPGCDWKGTYGNAANHHSSCPKFRLQCQNEECQHVCQREDLPMHAASCVKRKVPCPECGMPIKNELMDEHREKGCPHSVEPCPLSCGELLSRSQINLHLHNCPEKAVECQVPGCKRVIKRKNTAAHVVESAVSHFRLQSGEIQRLRREIHEKSNPQNQYGPKEKHSASFRWTIEKFLEFHALHRTKQEPLTSQAFIKTGHRWRGVIDNNSVFLQLRAAANPVTAHIRFVLMPGEHTKDKIVDVGRVTLKEGDMWGARVPDMNRFIDGNGNGNLAVKFIINYLEY